MTTEDDTQQQKRDAGWGRLVIAVYLVLAIAATFRSAYQLGTKFSEAPLAYSLSALAAVVYIVAAIALMRRTGVWLRIAWAALVFEFVGVLTVGILSFVVPELFAHPSVWSYFGVGYVFIPLVLPVSGIAWLLRLSRENRENRENRVNRGGRVKGTTE